jgi:protein O-mannosyl-transferase
MLCKPGISPAICLPSIDMSAPAEKRVVIFCLLLVAATLAFYNPIVHNTFTDFDDSVYILKNLQVQSGLSWNTVKWSFTTFHAGYWHPLTWLSHAFDCQIFRLNPVGHHYINLLLHAANAVLLFLLLWQATGLTWPSLVVSALFALHPINVESVAWVAERKNVLSMLFFLLALYAYDRYARTGKRYLYAAVAILFALGLMAKPQIVTLPFVLLLWDYWPLQRMGLMQMGSKQAYAASTVAGSPDSPAPRPFSFLVWEKWPLFILAAADSVITVIAQHAGSAVRTSAEVSIPARLDNVFVSYVRYLGKMFWPSHLAPMYPHPGDTLPPVEVLGALSLLLLISALVYHWRDRRYLLFGWLWFLGTLVPMIGIVTVGEQAMADRFAYIPCIGLFIAVVWTVNGGAPNAHALSKHSTVRPSVAWLAAAGAVICALGCLTYRQLGYWCDDETLWRYTVSVTDRNYMAHDNLAIALAKQGRSDEAVVEFRAANSLHKYPPVQIIALALYEERVGHAAEAIEECNSVLHASANANDPRLQAAAWSTLGQAHLQLRHYETAAESYQNALRLSPENEMALVGSGLVALGQEKSDEAIVDLEHAVKVDPSDVNFLLLAQALRLAGRSGDADLAAAEARKISPDLKASQSAAAQLLSVAGSTPQSATN